MELHLRIELEGSAEVTSTHPTALAERIVWVSNKLNSSERDINNFILSGLEPNPAVKGVKFSASQWGQVRGIGCVGKF